MEQRILPPDFDRNTKLGRKGEAVAVAIFAAFCVITVGVFAWLGLQG